MNRRVRVVARMAALLVALVPSGAAADCAAPELSAAAEIAAGQSLTVTGSGFGPCEDVGGGCSLGTSPDDAGVTVALLHDETILTAADISPEARGNFTVDLPPATAAAGRYEIRVTGRDDEAVLESRTVDVTQ